MRKISIPNGAWIMVADHSKAILLVNRGTPVVPQLEVRKVLEAPDNPATHEQGADAPGIRHVIIGDRNFRNNFGHGHILSRLDTSLNT